MKSLRQEGPIQTSPSKKAQINTISFPNLTGRHFVKLIRRATSMAKPLGPTGEFFRRRDEWRKHPMMTNQWRHATPGLGIALVAFGIYVVGEAAYKKIYAPNSHSTSTLAPAGSSTSSAH